MENLGKISLAKAVEEAIVGKIKDTIKNNINTFPCQFKDKDVNNAEFKIDVDAKIHLEIAGVSCDFEIHYPELPQK
ncbi:MAG: hypothetical protein LBD98_03190 [Endomicrobium sp.]|jgi:FKBP-type peptidyl-prolyl cis-trans isomerase (trigger factor)|nr:hypothetical protein [Endomicrobium sp.]